MITIEYNQVQEKHVTDGSGTASEAKKVYVGNKLAHVHVNDNTEFALRQTLNGYIHEDNDLYAKISKIKGNTKVWNQLVQNPTFVDSSGWSAVNGTGTVSNNEYSFVMGSISLSAARIQTTIDVSANHVYLFVYNINPDKDTYTRWGVGYNGQFGKDRQAPAGVWTKYAMIRTIDRSGSLLFYLYCNVGTINLSAGDTVKYRNINLYDLTLIYGAGNEPTTVAEFEADFQQWFGRPIGAEPYDAGSLIPFQATGIKSTWTKDGVQKEFTVPIPVTTLTGKQSGSSTSELIFPDGMKSAESVKDELYVEDGKTYAEKKDGSRDMGTLNWIATTPNFFYAEVSDMKQPITYSDRLNGIVCSKYPVDTVPDVAEIATDKTFKRRLSYIYVRDTSYTDANTFKAAMQGVMLYYELATPIVYEVDNYTLPLYYLANGTGTEEIVSTATSAPADMDIEYRLRQRVRLVDMGTPGVLWADSDIDITKPDGFCDSPFTYDKSFFSWGNVVGHNPISNTAFDYDWGSINQAEPWYEGQVYGSTPGSTLTGNIPADAQYDAAKAILGGNWMTPSNSEYANLFSICKFLEANGSDMDTSKTDKRVDMPDGNGGTVKGIYIESTVTGNRLFFSCSGNGKGSLRNNYNSGGLYWSSTWNSEQYARSLNFSSGGIGFQSNNPRYLGFPIRPVFPISQ